MSATKSMIGTLQKAMRGGDKVVVVYISPNVMTLQGTGGPGSVFGIATGYGLDGQGFESRWGEIFRTCPDRPWGPPSLLYNGYRVFLGGRERPGRDADPSPLSSAFGHERVELTSTPATGRTACTEPQCLYKGDLKLYLFQGTAGDTEILAIRHSTLIGW